MRLLKVLVVFAIVTLGLSSCDAYYDGYGNGGYYPDRYYRQTDVYYVRKYPQKNYYYKRYKGYDRDHDHHHRRKGRHHGDRD